MKFWDMIDIKEDGDCWEWKSKKGTGLRAYTHYKGKSWGASRLAWFLSFGEIPHEMCVCHSCDNPPCCNPKHLFLGTVQDNIDDREEKGRNKMPLSKGEEHGHHKLTKVQVRKIRELYETTSHTYRSLSEVFGTNWSNIRNIVKRNTWGWLT